MRAAALRIAVVGHTNAGKTSLLRTLLRRADFGEVAERPGTTRHVEALSLEIDGRAALRFLDTPGLEDATALLEHLRGLDAGLPRLARVRAFLAGPAARAEFEQEAKVLRSLLDEADAGLLVIDARESAALPKYADELEILMLCGRPLMPVLNFVQAAGAAQEQAWHTLLAGHGLHAYVRFDAVAPFVGAEQHLYSDLGALLPERRAQLQQVAEHLLRERQERRAASLRLVAELLLGLAACREAVAQDSLSDTHARLAFVQAFRSMIAARTRRALDQLLSLHGFDRSMLAAAELPQLSGRWESDLFNPELLKQAGRQFGGGAVVGGAIGLAADVALAGLSLGAATSVGAALGGVLSQGMAPLGRRLANKLRGVLELSLEDAALLLPASQHLTLLQALEQRGHAALEVLNEQAGLRIEAEPAAQLLKALRPARAHPEWAQVPAPGAQRQVMRVTEALGRLMPLPSS